MKKFLMLMTVLLLLLVALLEIAIPHAVENILREQIMKSTAAQEIDLNLSSTPGAKVAIGEIDKVHVAANFGQIGEMNFQNLSLDGEDISLDMREVLFPADGKSDVNKLFRSVGGLELHGVINSDDLKNFIASKVDRLENAEIKITDEEISASGEIKVLGRTAEVDIAGIFIVDGGDVYFHATRLNVKNALIRQVNLDRYFGEMKILNSVSLPLNLKFDSVQLRDGEILLTAIKS